MKQKIKMMNDLDVERLQSNVNVNNHLSHYIYGSQEKFEYLQIIAEVVEKEAAFDKKNRAYEAHHQRYISSLGKIKRFQELTDRLITNAEWNLDTIYDIYLCIDENTPLDVHLSMFIPVLELHTSHGELYIYGIYYYYHHHRYHHSPLPIHYRTKTALVTTSS